MNNQPLPKPTQNQDKGGSNNNQQNNSKPGGSDKSNQGNKGGSNNSNNNNQNNNSSNRGDSKKPTPSNLPPKPGNQGKGGGPNKPGDDKGKSGVVFKSDDKKPTVPLAQKPDAAKPPETNIKVKFPPTSLSALSSMSSNTIPRDGEDKKPGSPGAPQSSSNPQSNKPLGGQTPPGSSAGSAQASKPPQQPIERTVLGTPIPQTRRGESLPVGLTQKPPGSSPSPAPKPVAPSASGGAPSGKTAPVPMAPSRTISKGGGQANASKSADPKFAKQRSPIMKFLPFILGGVVLLVVLIFAVSRLLGGGSSSLPAQTPTPAPVVNQDNPTSTPDAANIPVEVPSEQVEITYWGLWEPNEVLDGIISDFESANPGVKINYVKQSHKNYRERLQTAFDSGSGPDLFRYHASWVPMLKNNLYPIPTSLMTAKEFQENYYPIVADQLVTSGQYVGVPLMIDGLALFYNEEILESANETPPTTWTELKLLASKLTVSSADGIERAGLAIGNTSNVEHFPEIIALLMLQNGANFSEPNSQETKDALSFYTNFVLKDEVWDETMPSSTVAFARGDVAMMFAPSWRAHEINEQNPDLRYGVTTIPQLSEERVTWGSYWAEGINSSSQNKDEVVSFLGYLSSDENLRKLYSKASEIRAFGELYPKVGLADEVADDPVVAPYLDDALFAQSWYLNSYTHDNGLNDQMIEYYRDGINALLEGEKVDDVVETIDAGTAEVLSQYGISSQ